MITKVVAIGLACVVAAMAVSAVGTVSASGDNNMWNWGEDGYYEENNNNPFEDDDFPGYAPQNRSGI